MDRGKKAGTANSYKARITALEFALAERDATIAERDAQLTLLTAALAERDAKVELLIATLAERDAKLALLSEQVAKLVERDGQNSKNSHLPPSSDGPGARSGGSPAGKPGKPGGTKGHVGKFRLLQPAESVDEFVDVFPEVCLGCAEALPPTLDLGASRYQQLDLKHHRRHLTEWRRHAVTCLRCGAVTQAEYTRGKIPVHAFGPTLTAVVVMLTGTYHLSRRKAQRLLKELFAIEVSLGAISAMERRSSYALVAAHREAVRAVQTAHIKHTDATTWLRSGKLASLWVLATVAVTAYKIFDNGRRITIRPWIGSERGILVSDRATVFKYWSMKLRQVCHAHLLRKFVSFSERAGPDGAVGHDLLECVKLIFEYWHGFKDGSLTREEFQFFMQPLQRDFESAVKRGASCGSKAIAGACEDILDHREALWTFVTHEGVEPTNNHAELELRDLVLWRKRSFGTRSKRGDRFAERIMTVARTLRKRGGDVLSFLSQSIEAKLQGITAPRLIARSTP